MKMSVKPLRLGAILVVIACLHLQVCLSQFAQRQPIRNVPRTGSVSLASSNAYEREVDYGRVEVTKGVANSRTVTKANGGVRNGGVTSVSQSNALNREVDIGGLNIGSTLTRTQTKTNGAVSKAVSHDLNVGKYSLETTLSRDNKGFGLQRAPDGGVQFGLGALSIDLSRNNQPDSGAYTQAQAQAQGLNAKAKANSNSRTQTQQYGKVGVTNTVSQSNAISRTQQGQTSASTNGLAGGAFTNGATYGQGLRTVRTPAARAPVYGAPQRYPQQNYYTRPKRRAQFIPFVYPDENGRPNRPIRGKPNQRPVLFPQPVMQNANAQGLANNKNSLFEQQAGANTQTNQEINANGITQNNGASSIGSNLATDGSSGQVSSANVAQMNSVTNDGSQSSNNAQSQSLNFDANQQQASSANAGTNQIITATGQRNEANSGSQSTNNNQFGSSSNIANTNSAVFQEGNTRGSQADSSSQSIFQGNNGQNSATNTQSGVTSTMGADGSVTNSATSNASAVSQGGQSANAVAVASSSSGAGGGNNFANALGNAGAGGASANSGAFGNNLSAQGFANGKFGNRRVKKIVGFPNSYRPQRGSNDTIILRASPKSEIRGNNSPQIRIVQNTPSQRLPTGRVNSSVELFDEFDENERSGRTFSLIGDLIDSITPRCVRPCTADAYVRGICCETVVIIPPPQPNVCCRPQNVPQYYPILPQQPYPTTVPTTLVTTERPLLIVPPPTRSVLVLASPTTTYPLLQPQCCTTCTAQGYYGPPPCVRYTVPRVGPARVLLYVPPLG